ncbi:hypothetical protein RUM43_001649 [Polyplax serrata]|uniref:39S ribosomal protein L41, mitochondrial n=1 Tax=Polyplax serrata TaxID=468196 RepID=A0AAN8SE73_POLSC
MGKELNLAKLISIPVRNFSCSSVSYGSRNFRKFPLYNFRGRRVFKEQQAENPDPDIPIYTYGVREPGYTLNRKFHYVPEMEPELIVPDLTGFMLKPYVSYRAPDIIQSEFTAKDLFDAVYSDKIINDFKKGELDENGNPKEPNMYEKMTPEEAKLLARKTGTDIFS